MPRDGAQIYVLPFPNAVSDTTVESAVYNGFTADIAQDLNAPRPIVAGGTSAVNAHDAMIALKGEIAKQVVTNYDSYPWVNGSFYSAVGATGAPDGISGYAGIYYEDVTPQWAVIEARNLTTGVLYVRRKVANVWGAWMTSIAVDGAVAKAGDTMTGNLAINAADPTITLNKASAATAHATNVIGQTNALSRWTMQLGNGGIESGGNVGSDFTLYRYNDAGAVIDAPFGINRASGLATFSGQVNATNVFMSTVTPTTGTYHFGNTGTKYLNYDGANFSLIGGLLTTSHGITSSGSIFANGGALQGYAPTSAITLDLGNTTSGLHKYMRVSAIGGLEYINSANSAVIATLDDSGGLTLSGVLAAGITHRSPGWVNRTGQSGSYGSSVSNLNWTGAVTQLWIDSTNTGTITVTSDYRTKKDVAELPGMWNTVKTLRPIKYTQKDFGIFVADNVERWGFLAHELQETLISSAASGVKDAENEIQSFNPMTVIAALTKALQEAMTRIEALEAR